MNLLDFLIKRPPAGLIQDPNKVWQGPTSIAAPSGNVKGAGLLERVLPTPAGMDGLLSDEDMKSARTQGLLGLGASLLESSGPSTQPQGLGAALGKALTAGRGGFDNAVQGNLGTQMAGMKLKSAKSELQAGQNIQASRAALIAKHGQPNSSDPQAMAAWIDKVLPDLLGAGDEEMVGKLSEIRKSLGAGAVKPHFDTLDTGGTKVDRFIMPDGSIKVLGTTQKTPPPKDPNAPDPVSGINAQRMFNRTNQLADDYRSSTKRVALAADQFRTLRSAEAAAKAGSPQAQISLVFSFMKTLDPTSVVRESEYATAANAAGVPERTRNQYNKLLKGAFLTPEQVDGFIKTGEQTARGWQNQQKVHQRDYEARARRWGITPTDVTTDFFEGLFPEPVKPGTSLFPKRK